MLHAFRGPGLPMVALTFIILAASCRMDGLLRPTPGPPFQCDSIITTTHLQDRDPASMLTGTAQGHEVHDCQQLVTEAGRFGPLVGLYPMSPAIDQPTDSFTTARAVATVYNWGQPYRELGLRGRWNCLWLQNRTGSATDWRAAIAKQGNNGCGDPRPDLPEGDVPLDVQFTPARGGRSYPATARWGWNDTASAHYVGTRCGDGWCDIAPEGVGAGPSPQARRLRATLGWYDEQRLAVPDAQGQLRPGPWGGIYPSPRLAQLREQDFDTPQMVATVTLEGTASQRAAYREKWNFHDGDNTLLLYRDTTQVADSVRWFMIVRPSATGAPTDTFTVHRDTTRAHGVRGAVRWRWDAEDERPWIGCDLSCCSPMNRVQ